MSREGSLAVTLERELFILAVGAQGPQGVTGAQGEQGLPAELGTELTGLSQLATTGVMVRTGAGTYVTRTLTAGTPNQILISDGDGVLGNPTFSIHSSYIGQSSITTLGTIGTGVWQGTVITPTYGGTGLSALGTANQILGVNSGGTAAEYKSLLGTSNQVVVTHGTGSATLSTPQNIHTGASPTFAGMTLSGMTSGSVLFAGTSGVVSQDNSNLFWNDTNNRLGVRTTSPSTLLHLNIGNTSGSPDEGLRLEVTGNAGSARGPKIVFYGPAGAGTSSNNGELHSTNGYMNLVNGSGVSLLYINKITAYAAQVGGGTALDWLGNTRVLQVKSSTALVDYNDGSTNMQSGLYSNWYRNNAATNNIIANGYYGHLTFNYYNGVWGLFNSATSGVAGGGATPVERLRVTAAGNLLIGTTTETASSGLIQLATGTTAASGILWGTDTNLYRSAANTLKTDDALTIADTTASTSSTTGALIVSGGVGIAKDSHINSVRIGRGASSIAHNIAIGESSPLGAITTGGRNIAIGSGALAAVTTTYTNTAIGYLAGNAYTGIGSTFIGAYAGYNRVSGDYNVVLGGVVGGAATGAGNVMVGRTAGGLTSGAYNTVVGHAAGGSISSGGSNVCIGESAGYALSQGGQNVIIGAGSATGWYSAAPALTTGIQNIFIGSGSGQSNVSGNYNVSVGNIAGFSSTTSNNIFIGNMAGRYATTQSSELFIDNQNRTNRAGDIAGAIIYGVMNPTPASQTLTINAATTVSSTTASTSSTTGALIVAGGVGIAKDSWINSVRIGRGNNALSTNTVLGVGALAGANSGTAQNTAIGYQALAANTTGNGNVAIGASAQSTSTTGAANISVGNGNLGANNGLYNVAIGHASQDTATSNYNIAVGGLTLRAATGVSNVAIGYQAGQTVSSGYQNTLVGNSAGASTTTAWANTMVGYQAGYHSTGLNNVFVGYNSGINVIAGSYNTLVGSNTWPASTTINNNIVLSDGQGNIKYRYDATNVTYTANSGYHSFVSTGSAEQVRITHTASANRYIMMTGSNGGNPTISTTAGSLAITPAIVAASTISALAITGNSFIPNAATVPTNGMYLEAANNPAFAANSTKIFEYDSTGIQIAGALTTLGGATFHTTSTALTDGVGAGAGTITNAPAAGNPSKWIGINDNGTTRYIPAW